MRERMKQEKGISMLSLIITIIILLILTNVMIYNARDNMYIKALANLYNDIEILNSKVSEYYERYGNIPASTEYINVNKLSNIISKNNDTGKFYIIDLEAMQGITLNYGKDYKNIKNDIENINNYEDVYIINENSHNIFYVRGVNIEENGNIITYYTNYRKPDETIVDLRYIDGILIPDGYYYIGKQDENIIISKDKTEKINDTSENQYIWQKNIAILEKVPNSIQLPEELEEEFLKSVNCYKGFFKNKNKTENIDVVYKKVEEKNWSEEYTENKIYTDKNGDTACIPKGFRVSLEEGTSEIINGLVITDQINEETNESIGNEFVWIPVDNFDEFIREDFEINPTDEKYFITTEPTENRYYEISGDRRTKENEADNIYESIYENKGFYIGRYETGIEEDTVRTSISDIAQKAVVKKNKYIYNYIQWANSIEDETGGAVEKARELYENSTLCYGVQWDAIMRWISKDYNVKSVLEDSTKFGNYSETKNLIKTGNYEEYKIKNIYDLAGNVEEWTMETYGIDYKVARGSKSGDNNTIAFRQDNQVNTKSGLIGFRIALYIK
ncbi:MAG: formylglycine-generating enzyme family protein [Clostridia bacterium]|nr:formylglycine-generating enzyme family protein [Clostridia bacterium]